MSVQNENASSAGETVVLERPEAGGVYASLFEKINLKPVLYDTADATANSRINARLPYDCCHSDGFFNYPFIRKK